MESTVREVRPDITEKMWMEHAKQPLAHRYQWNPYYSPREVNAKDFMENPFIKFPPYPRPEPFPLPLPLISAYYTPYLAHAFPWPTYSRPSHEPPRPTLSYDEYKYEYRGTSPFSLHSDEPSPSFSQVEI